MIIQLKRETDAIVWAAELAERIRQLMNERAVDQCGLIAARADRLDPSELKDLQTRFGMEDSPHPIQFAYDLQQGLLTVLLPGQSLAQAHFMSLLVKDFLLAADRLSGRTVVAVFPGEEPMEHTLRIMMLDLSDEEGQEDFEIILAPGRKPKDKTQSIVLIDQNEDLIEFLRARLRLKGYDVSTASDGIQGLRLAERLSPDLVVTELLLSELDGYEVIHRIREAQAAGERCKIMVLTDKGLDLEVQKCFELGVDDYVKKPFSPVELEARIRRLIG
jgi:CheY-like chemotaxis protein